MNKIFLIALVAVSLNVCAVARAADSCDAESETPAELARAARDTVSKVEAYLKKLFARIAEGSVEDTSDTKKGPEHYPMDEKLPPFGDLTKFPKKIKGAN